MHICQHYSNVGQEGAYHCLGMRVEDLWSDLVSAACNRRLRTVQVPEQANHPLRNIQLYSLNKLASFLAAGSWGEEEILKDLFGLHHSSYAEDWGQQL